MEKTSCLFTPQTGVGMGVLWNQPETFPVSLMVELKVATGKEEQAI